MRKFLLSVAVVILSASICTGCSLFSRKDTNKEGKEDVIAYGEGSGAQAAATMEEPAPVIDTVYEENDTELGGIPVISGEYSLEDCIELPNLAAIEGKYDMELFPNYEDARVYVMLSKDAHRIPEDSDEIVQYGDKATIDLIVEGSDDDIMEGSLTNIEVPVGGGTVDPKIEEAIVGMSIGQDREVTVETEDGKVTYHIFLTSFARPDEPMETEVVQALEDLTEEYGDLNSYKRYTSLKREILEKTTIKAYPEKIVRQARSRYEAKYLRDGMSLNDYLNQEGMTKAEFKEYEDAYAQTAANEMLLLEALSKRAGVTKESAEYKELEEKEGENPEDPDALLYRLIFDRLFGGGE